MMTTHKGNRGFGLIEILITLGVLTIGILGVAVLNSVITKQSLDNKARAEALAIVQSRIEEMRNYTGTAATAAEFAALYVDTTGFENTATVTGINAAFTRTESIATDGELKNIIVNVAWTDPEGEAQNISLDADLAFMSPRSVGDMAIESSESLVDAPTGRARLGEGQLPGGAVTVANGDGTSLYDGNFERMLVADDQIVLTLTEACQTEAGSCIDFVRIKGTIYIDKTSQPSLEPGDVHVVASDAAYCARYFVPADATEPVPITSTTTQALMTAGGDYEYFSYTCYLGGGWHGNVGVLLAGGMQQTDKICVGDPVTGDAFAQPIIASRRVYRGMLYKWDASNTSSDSTAGKETILSAGGEPMIRYYSQGIKDQAVLPDPNTTDKGHDFIIASMAASDTDGSNCTSKSIMLRTDSDEDMDGSPGDLFAGMPDDFVCLNVGLVDNYDTAVYGHDAVDCPYNPSDPPSSRHLVTGMIDVQTVDTAENDALMTGVTTLTSDGPSNCRMDAGGFVHNGTQYSSSYECDVYDWGNGWNGYIEVIYDASNMRCTPNRLTLTSVTTNDAGNDYANCSPGTFAVISGTVAAANNRKLATAVLSDGGTCTIAVGGLSYQCVTQEFLVDTLTWTGTVSFTATGGTVCSTPSNDGVHTFTALASGFETRNLIIENNANGCP